MSLMLRHQVILGLIAGLVYFTNLGGYALFDEDEPKNAVCGKEMFERGDWVVPTFNATLRPDKPVLIYWWMHLTYWCFGVSEFSARFGSALLTSGTVLLTYHLGRKLYSPSIGFLAGIVLATSMMFSAVGRAATPDATLVFCLMLAFTSYVVAVASRRQGHFCGALSGQAASRSSWTELVPSSPWAAIPIYASMGLAILAKGPIGVLLPCLIIGLFLLVSIRRSDIQNGRVPATTGPWWRRILVAAFQVVNPVRVVRATIAMRLLLGTAVVLLVAAPWYILVGLQTDGAFLRGFLGNHNVERFLEAKEGHSGPVFFYVIVLMAGCFPWTGFLPLAAWRLTSRLTSDGEWPLLAVHPLKKSEDQQPDGPECPSSGDSDRFLACWLGVWLVFFSIASTKLPNYVLPMYPAMALIMARYLDEWQHASAEWSTLVFRQCCRIYAAAGTVTIIGIAVTMSKLIPGEEWLGVIGAVPLLGGGAAYAAAVGEHRVRAIRILLVTAVTLMVLALAVAPTRFHSFQEIPQFAEAARRISGRISPEVALVDGFSPNLLFYMRRPIEHLSPDQVATYLSKHPGGFIVTRSDRVNALPQAHSSLIEVSRCRRLLRNYDLVLLARKIDIAAETIPQRH